MKQRILTMTLVLAPALMAGNAATGCLHAVGRGAEHGTMAAAHAVKAVEHGAVTGTRTAFKDVGKACGKLLAD